MSKDSSKEDEIPLLSLLKKDPTQMNDEELIENIKQLRTNATSAQTRQKSVRAKKKTGADLFDVDSFL